MKYLIVSYKNKAFYNLHSLELMNYILSLDESDAYEDALKSSLLHSSAKIADIMKDRGELSKNMEFDHNEVKIFLPLSHQYITMCLEKYAIMIESDNKNNIFFDIIYHNLKNYVIIEQYY